MTVVANQINTQEDKNQEVSQKVEAILKARFSGEENTDLMKKQILDVLNGDKQKAVFLLSKDIGLFQYLPEKLQRDMDIIKVGLEKDPKIYKNLDITSKQDIEIQKITLQAIVSSGGDLFDIIEVLDFTKKSQKKLQAFTDALINDNKNFFPDEASRLFYEIYKSEKKLYKLIREKGLLADSHSGITLGSGIVKYLSKNIPALEGESVEDSENKIFLALCEFLSLDEKSLGITGNKLLRILISQISITQKTQEVEGEQTGEQENSHESSLSDISEQDDEIDYSVGPYNYVPVGNSCRVWEEGGSSVVIEKPIFENMSEKSLENFMNFSKLMKNLGLEFLITKQHNFIQIATGINLYQGEGMSQGKTLSFLNSIGKNIGVPEQSYEDSDGNKKVGSFKSLGAAIMHFKEVRDSGKIGELNIDVSKKGDKSIVEIYMKYIGLIAGPYDELSIANWKK